MIIGAIAQDCLLSDTREESPRGVVFYFAFARLGAFASLRETFFPDSSFHAKAESRKENRKEDARREVSCAARRLGTFLINGSE